MPGFRGCAILCEMENELFRLVRPAALHGRRARSASLFCRMGLLSLLTVALVGCGGTSSPPQPRVLLSIAVQPNPASAVKQRQVAFSVTGAFNQAPTTQANLAAAWASSDSTIATINPSTGLADCVAVGGPVTISASVKSSNGSLKQASANFTCTPWATIPLGRCLVDSNNALTGQCAGAQLLNPKYCSVTTDNVACAVGQPSTSTQTRLCGSAATGMNVTVDISTACK
jgi:Bacterial Ig-like domain (group 2)